MMLRDARPALILLIAIAARSVISSRPASSGGGNPAPRA
jgi:hypothetical protein